MTTQSIINQIKLQSPKGLAKTYEGVCEEYRKRLCEAWEIRFDESWWHGDEIGGGLFLGDWWASLDMQEIRYIVDNGVTYEAWMAYCAFMESEIINGNNRPRINFTAWFKFGARPKDLKDGINPQDKESVEA